MSIVGSAMGVMSQTFGMFTSPATYERRPASGTPTTGQIQVFARGLRGQALLAAADQFDTLVVMRKADLERLGMYPPQRFDRVTLGPRTYSVEDWTPSPASGDPEFLRLWARGAGR